MARSNGGKSRAIRQHISLHPDDGPAAVVAALQKQGVKVSRQHVSAIQNEPLVRPKMGRPRHLPPGAVTVDGLDLAREFVARVGGVAEARRLLAILERLRSRAAG